MYVNKESLLSEICVQKRFGKPYSVTETEVGVVNGAPLDLLMLSSGNEFTNPSRFVQRKKEHPINNFDYEVNMKRKHCSDFEAENRQTKKQ